MSAALSLDENRTSMGPARHLGAGVLFGIITILIYLAAEFWEPLGKPWDPGVSAILAFTCFVLHMAFSYRRIGSIDPVVWVPVAILAFYFGIPVAVGLFGLEPIVAYDAWGVGLSPSLSRGYCTALLTLVCYLWGIQLAGLVDLSREPLNPSSSDQSLAQPALIMTMGGWVMFVAGAIILGPSAVFGTYSQYWDAKTFGGDPRFFDTSNVFLQAGVFGLLASYNPRRRFRTLVAWVTSMLLVVAGIQNGMRSFLIALGIGFGWCYSQRVRRLPAVVTMTVVVFVFLLLPVIGRYRVNKRVNEIVSMSPSELSSAALKEMGGSALAFAYTLDYIPRTKDYAYGISFLGEILDLIPNLGLTAGNKIFAILTTESQPSAWITAKLAPDWFASGGGFGYAMGAEWYFNFGMLGIVVGVTLTGYLVTRLRNASQSSALTLVSSALAFAGAAIFVRNNIGVSLKMVVWPIFGLWLIKRVTNSIGRRGLVMQEASQLAARNAGDADGLPRTR